MKHFFILWGLLTFAVSGFAQGTTRTVFPLGYETQEGNGADRVFSSPHDRQQWIQSAYLAEVWQQPVLISEVAFRVDGGRSQIETTIPHLEIWFGTTSFEWNNLNSEARGFEINVGDTARRVFASDAVVISAPGGAGPNSFAVQFTLDQPFYYDTAQGHLMMRVLTSGGASFPGGNTIDLQHFELPPPMAIPGLGPQGRAIGAGIVTQFSWIAVPEPSVSGLLVAAASLGLLRRRHER